MIALFWAAAALAQDDSRDEDIFGAPEGPPAEAPAEPPAEEPPALEQPPEGTPEGPPAQIPPPAEPSEGAPAEDAGFGEVDFDRTSESDIASRMLLREDLVTIGGRAFLQAQGTLSDGEKLGEWPLTAPTLFDLFVDARPNDRVRLYARGRLQHDFTVFAGDVDAFGNERVPSRVILDQLWLKGDVGRKVFWTVGRQRIKWGAGRFWNPTDFMNQQVLNPLAVLDVRTGVPLIKAHVPFEALGGNVYVLANAAGASALEEVGLAARAEWLIGNTEITASGAVQKGEPVRLGADVSTGVWIFDLRAEAAVRHGDESAYWEGELDFEMFALPTEVDRSDDWIPQVVVGAETSFRYNDEDALYLGAEFFWNDAGYEDAELYPWLLANGQFQPFYLGREYLGVYALLPGPGRADDHTFTASFLSNLSDGSAIARLDWRATVLTHLSVNAFGGYRFGNEGEYRFGLEIPPIPGDPVLGEGLTIPVPIVDLGFGATLTF